MAPDNHDKLKKVLLWVNDYHEDNPALSLKEIYRKAAIDFDLTPRESEFIERNFTPDD